MRRKKKRGRDEFSRKGKSRKPVVENRHNMLAGRPVHRKGKSPGTVEKNSKSANEKVWTKPLVAPVLQTVLRTAELVTKPESSTENNQKPAQVNRRVQQEGVARSQPLIQS